MTATTTTKNETNAYAAVRAAIAADTGTAAKWVTAAELCLVMYPTEAAFAGARQDVLAMIATACGPNVANAIARKIERTDKSDAAERARSEKKNALAKVHVYTTRLRGYMFPKAPAAKGPQATADLATRCRKDLESVLKRCKATEGSTFDLIAFTKKVTEALAMLK